jgi:hypothetical protein
MPLDNWFSAFPDNIVVSSSQVKMPKKNDLQKHVLFNPNILHLPCILLHYSLISWNVAGSIPDGVTGMFH